MSALSHRCRPRTPSLQPRPGPRPQHGLTSFISGQYAHARTHGCNACGSCLLAKSLVPTNRRLVAWPIVAAQTARYLSLSPPSRCERGCRSFHESRSARGGRTCVRYISRLVSGIPQCSCALPDVVETSWLTPAFPPTIPLACSAESTDGVDSYVATISCVPSESYMSNIHSSRNGSLSLTSGWSLAASSTTVRCAASLTR